MFKSKRSGLVRRLWRSRLVTESDARDGGVRGEGARGWHPGKLHSLEQRAVTHADPAPGLAGGAGDLPESADREDDEQPDDDRGATCVPEPRGSRRAQDGDSRAVTCCLFGKWDLRARRKDGARSGQRAPPRAGLEEELAGAAHAVLKRLREKSLDALVKAVETGGGIPGECVMVPRTELRLGAHRVSPQFVLCRLFRWSDLPPSAALKALCHCQSFGAADGAKVCCNPHHYSRLCAPESPPPPYSHSDQQQPLDSTRSYTEPAPPHNTPRDYTDTGTSLGSSSSSSSCCSSSSGAPRSHWCSVAYWEHRTRVGRLYPAYEPSLSIFYDLPQGSGLCLGQLQANAYHSRRRDPGGHGGAGEGPGGSGGGPGGGGGGVQQTRRKIGFGIVLSREPDGVWIYNRGRHPVFVHSPTLDPPGARGLSVTRVLPGFSLKAFDYDCSGWMEAHGVKPQSQEGPWDPRSIRISFAKGWGPCYCRQFITSCPCWLEVLLNR